MNFSKNLLKHRHSCLNWISGTPNLLSEGLVQQCCMIGYSHIFLTRRLSHAAKKGFTVFPAIMYDHLESSPSHII